MTVEELLAPRKKGEEDRPKRRQRTDESDDKWYESEDYEEFEDVIEKE